MKKVICFLGVVIPFFLSSQALSGTLGDINADGRIDLQEAIYALQVVAGIRPALTIIDVASYANFHGKWIYHNTEADYETPSVEVIGTGIKNGKEVYILQEYDPEGYPNDQSYYFADMSIGLYSSGGINNYQDPDQEIFYWNPGMPYLLASFVPGKGYPFQSTNSSDNSIVNGTISIESESVTVPAGTFTDCYKVTLSGSHGGENFTFYRWYAKNIGLVKRVGFGGGTWELTSYIP